MFGGLFFNIGYFGASTELFGWFAESHHTHAFIPGVKTVRLEFMLDFHFGCTVIQEPAAHSRESHIKPSLYKLKQTINRFKVETIDLTFDR